MESSSHKVVLVIDDEAGILEVLQSCFSELGYKVYTASGIDETIFALNQELPDVVFLDIVLPRVDGLDILRLLKKFKKDIVVVMMSGYATEEKAKFALEQGAFDYINKPFMLEQVRNMMAMLDKSLL